MRVYECKDGRVRCYIEGEHRVISYPKYLMEQKLGRKLEKDEQVHHIDKNPLNNDLSNLELRHSGEHQREHAKKYFDKPMVCSVCKKEFIWTAKQHRYHYGNQHMKGTSRVCCSKRCVGLSAHELKNADVVELEYTSRLNRDAERIEGSIPSVCTKYDWR